MASLHTISNCINNPHRKYRKFCIKQQPEENTVYPGVFVNYNTKKATASNSLQFLTVTCWCFKEVYQSALPASRFILNDPASETIQK